MLGSSSAPASSSTGASYSSSLSITSFFQYGFLAALAYILAGAPLSSLLTSNVGGDAVSSNSVGARGGGDVKANLENLVIPERNLSCAAHTYKGVYVLSREPLVVYIEGFVGEEEGKEVVALRYVCSWSLHLRDIPRYKKGLWFLWDMPRNSDAAYLWMKRTQLTVQPQQPPLHPLNSMDLRHRILQTRDPQLRESTLTPQSNRQMHRRARPRVPRLAALHFHRETLEPEIWRRMSLHISLRLEHCDQEERAREFLHGVS